MKTILPVLVRQLRCVGAGCGLLACLLGTGLPVVADDIDVYTKQPSGALLPSTILVIDLNAFGICDNVLTNPSSQPQCGILQGGTTVATLLGNPTAQGVQDLSKATICNLYGALLSSGAIGVVSVGVLGSLLNPLTQITSAAACAALSTVPSSITNAVGSVVTPTVLGSYLSSLTPTLTSVLDNALPAANKVLADPTSIANLNTFLRGVLNPLINSNVGIVVSHGNRNGTATPNTGYTTGTPAKKYACQFNDVSTSSSLGSTRRSATAGCSNGGYFTLGFVNVNDPVATTNRILAMLLGTTINTGGTVTGGLFTPGTGVLTNPLLSGGTVSPTGLLTLLTSLSTLTLPLTPPFQDVENYVEIVHYLKDDVVYNGPLNTYDGPVFKPVGRDTAIETAPSAPASDSYTGGAATISNCRNVNVVNLMLTATSGDTDSDTEARTLFPGVASNAAGNVDLASLAGVAQTNGFIGKDGKTVYLNSYFVLQDNLLPNIGALQNLGVNVVNYSSALGLFNSGQTITQSQTLITNASLGTAASTFDRSSSTGLRAPTFFSSFKALSNRRPAWTGNLKRLDQSATPNSDGTYTYVGQNGAAIDTDGRIKTTALTIWTDATRLGGLSADGRESTLGGAGQQIVGYVPPTSNNATGGGGNPGIKNTTDPSVAARKLFYDSIPSAGAPTLKSLDADTTASSWTTQRAELAPFMNCPTTTGDTTCQALTLYARGYDVGTTASPASNLATVGSRPWLMGAVLHSRPVAVNYGARAGYSTTSPDIRVLFGSTDGFLRSVRNGGAPGGAESWAFMPRAAMADLKTLRDNVYNPQFPYGVDGAPSVLIIDRGPTSSTFPNGAPADGKLESSNSNDHVYAYFGLRRGGSAYATSGGNYYALDITDPDNPRLMWRIGRDGVYSANASSPGLVTGTGSQFTDLAQTFSNPAIGQMRFTNGSGNAVTRPVVIFGGGYNGGVTAAGALIGKDLNNTRNTTTANQVGRDDGVGNALYIVDGVTGELVWKAAKSSTSAIGVPASSTATPIFTHPMLQDGIASDVTALDTDGDGLTDRLYVGDTGGRVWRVDLGGIDRSKWSMGPIASLGRGHGSTADATAANDRRFFHAPDYVPGRDASGSYDVVLIGSGDREDPFNSTTVNWLYAIRDRTTATRTGTTGVIVGEGDANLITQNSLADLTTSCASASTGSSDSCASDSTLANGWRIQLGGSGEKATSAPLTIGKTVFVSTYLPSLTPSCTPSEGTSKIYGVSLREGRPFVQTFIDAGGGRAATAKAPGFSGEPSAQTLNTIGVDAETFSIGLNPNFNVYWRERRSDDEIPLRQ